MFFVPSCHVVVRLCARLRVVCVLSVQLCSCPSLWGRVSRPCVRLLCLCLLPVSVPVPLSLCAGGVWGLFPRGCARACGCERVSLRAVWGCSSIYGRPSAGETPAWGWCGGALSAVVHPCLVVRHTHVRLCVTPVFGCVTCPCAVVHLCSVVCHVRVRLCVTPTSACVTCPCTVVQPCSVVRCVHVYPNGCVGVVGLQVLCQYVCGCLSMRGCCVQHVLHVLCVCNRC